MIDRFHKNVVGDFYTDGSCLACELPEMEAPELLARLNGNNFDTYFIKQPETETELEQAISACEICCTNALRYSGKDRKILERLGEEFCDYKILENGDIVKNNDEKIILPKT